MLTIKDVTFASGQVQDILSAKKKHATSTATIKARSTNALLPDEVERFWVDIQNAMGRKDWSLPVVYRHK